MAGRINAVPIRPMRLLVVLLLVVIVSSCTQAPQTEVSPPEVVEDTSPTEEVSMETEEVPETDMGAERPECEVGGTLVFGQEQEPASMVLAESSTPVSAQYYTAFLNNEPLVLVDHEFNMLPGILAEVPTLENGGVSDDFTTYTLKMRPDLVWDDGTPNNADDIKFTWEWLTNEANAPYATHGWEKVESVEVSDDKLTAVVRLSEPFAFWLDEAVIRMGLAPKEALERLGSKEAYNNTPVGNGPFKVVEWVVGDHMTFERNDLYHRGPACLDGIIIKFLPDTNALLAQMLAGDIDIGLGFVEASIPELEAAEQINVITTHWPFMERIFLSQSVPGETDNPHPILTDINVRKALAFAIDKETIVDSLFFGINTIAVNELQNGPYFNESLEPYPYDPEESIRLLEESGWIDEDGDGIREKDGQRLSITYSTTAGNRTRESVQAIVQQNAADVGIELVIENYPPPKLFGGWAGILWGRQYELGEFANGIFTFSPNYGDWWHSSSIPTPDKPYGNGHSGWSDERLDEILAEHMAGVDDERAREILLEAQQIVYDGYPMVPLYQRSVIFVVNNRVKNVNPTDFGVHSGLYWEPHNWWIEE